MRSYRFKGGDHYAQKDQYRESLDEKGGQGCSQSQSPGEIRTNTVQYHTYIINVEEEGVMDICGWLSV